VAKELSASGVLSCDNNPGELDSPAVTKTITIRRTVTRVCEVITDLSFTVPTQLPAPEVPEADGEILDLRNFNGDATVIIRKWAFMEEGQKGWLECLGTLKDGTAYTLQLMDGEPITANEVENGISRVLLREELEKLLNDSPLTIVFKTAVDACCEDGPVITFPDTKFTIRTYYRDMTDFNDRTFGLWIKGAGAPDARDLTFESVGVEIDGTTNYAVKNFTYSNNNIGQILYRAFDDLEAGTTYRFSVSVRRYNLSNPPPKLSLRVDDVDKTDVVELTDVNTWVTLVGTFMPTGNSALLSLYSHELDAGIKGNDYLIDCLLVEEI
jgi:hypothetical protein